MIHMIIRKHFKDQKKNIQVVMKVMKLMIWYTKIIMNVMEKYFKNLAIHLHIIVQVIQIWIVK
jgi:hypothetical protein